MVPIHRGGGGEVTNVVSLVCSSVGLTDTSHIHRSKLGIINSLIPSSEMGIWLLVHKIKYIHTILIGISWKYLTFRQEWMFMDSVLAAEKYYLQLAIIFALVDHQHNTRGPQGGSFLEFPS